MSLDSYKHYIRLLSHNSLKNPRNLELNCFLAHFSYNSDCDTLSHLRQRGQMTICKLYLFGSPHLTQDDKPVDLGRRKAKALLAYLATTNQRHNREALAAMFWPELDQRRGRADLSRILSVLNKTLGTGVIEADRETVALHLTNEATAAETTLWVDISRFQALLFPAEPHDHPPDEICEACLSRLVEAVGLYRADFLQGFTLTDCPAFDDWQFFQSESLRQTAASTLERLVGNYLRRNNLDAAVSYARRWLTLDPLHEPAHRQLMQLYALTDQRAAALRQYEECQRILQQEVGVHPDTATTALYEAIKAKHFPAAASKKTTEPPPAALPKETTSEADFDIFVGRNRELARLTEALEAARRGSGQILFVIGGAGRGKSALVQEFARRAQALDPQLIVASGYCDAHTGIGDPYLPFREVLNLLTGEVNSKWLSNPQVERLQALVPLALPALVKHAPDLIDTFVPGQALLNRAGSLAAGRAPWFEQLQAMTTDPTSALEQKHIFAQYTAFLQAMAAQRPLLLILEDLNWSDTSSSGLLFHLSRHIAGSRILIIGTYRPDEMTLSWRDDRHPLAGIISELKRQRGDIWLDLGDVPWGEGRYFVDAYLDAHPNRFSESFKELLFRRTGGHALFTVELLRDMFERGEIKKDDRGYWIEGEVIDWDTVPAKVEGVIEKRIARLDSELQNLLTIASVEGEVFAAEVVARVQQLDEQYVVRQFSRELGKRHRLVVTQSLELLGRQRLSHYRFRHHLFQYYVYHKLDDMERAYLHEAVGSALETLYQGQTEVVAVRLAHHFEQAGLTHKAVDYLLQAGQQALRLSANEAAIGHLSRGLALLEALPHSNKQFQQELELQLAIGPAYVAVNSHGSPEVQRAYLRAQELAEALAEPKKLFQALWGRSIFCLVRSETRKARALAAQCLQIAQEQQEPALFLPAHRMLGASLFNLGEFRLAWEHIQQGVAAYNAQPFLSSPLLYGQDNGIACLSYASWALCLLGYPDQALQQSSDTIDRAQKLAHPFSLVFTLCWAAALHQFRRESQAALARAEAAIVLAAEYRFMHWLSWATILKGWALAMQGDTETGIKLIRQGLDKWRALPMEATEPYFLGLLAEVYGLAGQIESGLEAVSEALARAEITGEHFWDAELYRLQGELFLLNGDERAETIFLQAIEMARSQEAKILELRAMVSLQQLRLGRGNRDQDDQLLANIYDWFREGFDLPDLLKAQRLLSQIKTASPVVS